MRRCVAIAIDTLVHGSVLALATACGLPSPSMSSTTGAETGDDGGTAVEGGDDGQDDAEASRCDAEIAVLAPFVTHPEGGCSVVLRIHHETLALLGYQSTCAPYRDTRLDEPQARALTQCCTSAGEPLAAPADQEPDDLELWVLYVMPGMPNDLGGVAVVSNHVAERLFEGTIAGDGDGEGGIVYPDTWYEPTALGSGCGAVPIPEGLRSYDLVEGGAIAEERLREVWRVVSSTALLFAMSVVGEPQRATMLRYPRRVDAFDPSTAEYVVVIEGGIPRDPAPD